MLENAIVDTNSRHLLNQIARKVQAGELVFFIGAGVSKSVYSGYPTSEELKKALLEETDTQQDPSTRPAWLERCRQPRFRQSLFIAGAGLVLITFIFFGTPAKIAKKSQ